MTESNSFDFLCASLTDQVKRKKSFAKCFLDQSRFKFIDSIDGRNWTEEEADSFCSEEIQALRRREKQKGAHWINPAYIACTLTHRDRLLHTAQYKTVILCEDDVIISPDFIKQWSSADFKTKMDSLDGIVLLHYFSRTPITTSSAPELNTGKYQVYKIDSGEVVSGACYFASRKVAKSIVQGQTPISTGVDQWTEMRRKHYFSEIYVVHPSPCQIAGLASNIGYGNDSKSNAILMVWARRLKRIFNRNRKQFYESLSFRPSREHTQSATTQ